MSRRVKAARGRGARRGTFIWVIGAVLFVAALLYWEQTALLYVLSTLAMCALLLVVAFSDLEGRDRGLQKREVVGEAGEAGDSATSSPNEIAAPPIKRRGRAATRRRVS